MPAMMLPGKRRTAAELVQRLRIAKHDQVAAAERGGQPGPHRPDTPFDPAFFQVETDAGSERVGQFLFLPVKREKHRIEHVVHTHAPDDRPDAA